MSENNFYPRCGICGKGTLLPVNMGNEEDPAVKYACTNPKCCARFDQYGYETYDPEAKAWVREDI